MMTSSENHQVFLIIGKLKTLRWDKYGDLAIFVVTGFGGSFLVGMGYTSEIFVAYIGYILFRMSYQTMMTVASFEIAKVVNGRVSFYDNLSHDSPS